MENETENNPSTQNPEIVETPTPPIVTAVAPGAKAQLGSRIGAYLVDLVIGIGLMIVVGMVSSKLGNLVGLAYLLTRDALPFLDGQSIGKKLLKIQAVSEDGKSLSGNWSQGLVRNAVLLIPFFPLVELVILIVNKDKPNGDRRLGDQWAKTKVVSAA